MGKQLLCFFAISCVFAYTASHSVIQLVTASPSNLTTGTPLPANLSNATKPTNPPYATCPEKILPCSATILGNLVLMLFYGIILAVAAKLISDGAELLLDLGLPAALIGGLVLPVLGAVPDAAIIVVSGATGSQKAAQESLQIGMGTLAGSTIMLLTLPWFGSLILGRNDIQANGEAKDCTGQGFSLIHQGVTLLPDVLNGIIIMLVTSASYLIVQSADWYFGPTNIAKQPAYIRQAAAATMAFALAGLVFYLVFQLYDSRSADRRAEEHRQEMLLRRVAARLYLMASHTAFTPPTDQTDAPEETSPLVQKEGEPTGGALQKKYYSAWRARGSVSDPEEEVKQEVEEVKEAEEEAEEEHESKRMLAFKSFSQLGLGVALVVIFSDPMCDVLTELTNPKNKSYIPVRAFYVSFVVTPLCSNASELLSSLMFAMKKKKLTISMTYAQLYGAASMNNTLCLAIFMGLVYFRRLDWVYSAEVFVIILVQLVVGIIGYRKTYRVWLGIPIAALYFISIALVAFLESSVVGWK